MIRLATIHDASRIAEIKIFGWRYAYRGIIEDTILFTELNIERKSKSIRMKIKEGCEEIYVFEEDSIIKAMMILGPSRDVDKPNAFELYCLYVDPLMLHNGIGVQMLNYCENEGRTRGYKENILWALGGNEIGKRFYKKNGYNEDGEVREIEALRVKEIRYSKIL